MTEPLNKPIVKYRHIMGGIIPGKVAYVFPADHPLVSNMEWIITSRIIKLGDKPGEFETENTQYVPY